MTVCLCLSWHYSHIEFWIKQFQPLFIENPMRSIIKCATNNKKAFQIPILSINITSEWEKWFWLSMGAVARSKRLGIAFKLNLSCCVALSLHVVWQGASNAFSNKSNEINGITMCTEEYWKKDEHFFLCEKVKILDTIMFELNPLSSQMTDRVYYAISLPYSFHVGHVGHVGHTHTVRQHNPDGPHDINRWRLKKWL